MTFHTLATPTITPAVVLNRLAKMTAKTSGLSSLFMLSQYSSPLVVALLMALAKLRAKYRKGGGETLLTMARGWANVSAATGETRTVMRAAGLLPILQWLFALYPNPIGSLRSTITNPSLSALSNAKTIPTIQALSLAVYYPAEHVWWLSSKGVLGLSPESVGKAGMWLMRGWAVYVAVEVYKILNQLMVLRYRTARLRNTKPSLDVAAAEGYEIQEKSTAVSGGANVEHQQVTALKNDWEDWTLNAAMYAGYAPLTAHWCTPGGLGAMKNPWVYAGLGTMTALSSVLTQWKAAA